MIPKFQLRAPGAYDPDQASQDAGLACPEVEGMTQQQFREECDINTIVRRFGLTGQLPEQLAMPQSGDFTGIGTFHEAMTLVRQAEEEFMRLPPEVRSRFSNDPGRLIAFVDDAANRDEAIKLGLIPKPPEVARDGSPVPPAPPAP